MLTLLSRGPQARARRASRFGAGTAVAHTGHIGAQTRFDVVNLYKHRKCPSLRPRPYPLRYLHRVPSCRRTHQPSPDRKRENTNSTSKFDGKVFRGEENQSGCRAHDIQLINQNYHIPISKIDSLALWGVDFQNVGFLSQRIYGILPEPLFFSPPKPCTRTKMVRTFFTLIQCGYFSFYSFRSYN